MRVKGISHEELAVRLGAQPGTTMDPDTAHETLKLSPGAWDLPDCAMLGETGNGWAFAVESPEARDRVDRLAPGRDMWSKHTVVSIWDSTMDPPIINVNVDADHPLTRRLVAEGGLGVRFVRVHRDDESDDVTMSDDYKVRDYKVRDIPGHPPQGCPGEQRSPAHLLPRGSERGLFVSAGQTVTGGTARDDPRGSRRQRSRYRPDPRSTSRSAPTAPSAAGARCRPRPPTAPRAPRRRRPPGARA